MQHLPRLRVLVVQDDPILQKIACNLATCSGMVVRSGNGQSPVQLLVEAEGATDLVLIGWSSLMADDRAALQFLRRAEETRIPCIVHLPDDDGQKVRQAQALGLPAVLPRLFSSQTLQELAMQTAGAVVPAQALGEPLGETAGDKARRLFAEGREALKAKELDRAIAAFSKILAMRGRFPDACRGLAVAWQRKGDVARFHHYLNKAAEGYVWRGLNAEAEKLYQDMKRSRCLVVNPYQAVADVVFQRGRADAAIVLYEKAQALDPDDAGLRLTLARLCRMLHRDAAALEHVVAILHRDGRHVAAMALYADIAGKRWQAPASLPSLPSLSDGEGVWDVEALAACEDADCEDVGASGPVVFLDSSALAGTPAFG